MPILTTTAAPTLTDLPPAGPQPGSAAATERATLEAVLEHGSDAVIGLDAAGRVLSWNGRAEQLLGWARDSALGRPLGGLCMTAAARAHYEQTLQLVLESGDTALLPQRAAWTLQQRGGTEVAVEATVVALPAAAAAAPAPAPARFLAILHDSSERQMLLAALEMMALRDPLTRLPNRRALMQVLPEAMQRAVRIGRPLALLLVRAGGLRHVNQQHGHEQGDALLTQVAARLSATLRRTDTVARLAGDEFVAVLEMLNTADNARDSADKLLAALSLPFVVDGAVVQLNAQIGVALHWPDGDADATALLHRAELALPAVPPAPTEQPAQAA